MLNGNGTLLFECIPKYVNIEPLVDFGVKVLRQFIICVDQMKFAQISAISNEIHHIRLLNVRFYNQRNMFQIRKFSSQSRKLITVYGALFHDHFNFKLFNAFKLAKIINKTVNKIQNKI